REIATVREALGLSETDVTEVCSVPSPGPGNAVTVAVVSDAITEVFSAFGRKRVPAEEVGREVASEVRDHLDRGVPVGPHLADQLMVPLSLVGGRFLTGPLTDHSRTAIAIIERFLGRSPRAEAQDDQRLLVECSI
ncbi:MAG: RNA 3'-terminal phosphate cyclase, partial [Myxococcota bacterium]